MPSFQPRKSEPLAQAIVCDSSRCAETSNGPVYLGVSSAGYRTLALGRQNTLDLDLMAAYDPMALSYAFSLIHRHRLPLFVWEAFCRLPLRRLACKSVGVEPEHRPVRATMQPLRMSAFSGGTERHIERQKMLFSWVVLLSKRRKLAVLQKIVCAIFDKRLAEPLCKSRDPLRLPI